MKLAFMAALALLLAPAIAFAANPLFEADGAGGLQPAGGTVCSGTVCYSQPYAGSGSSILSQDDPDVGGFGSGDAGVRAASDFVGCDDEVVRIHFWGAYDAEAYDCGAGFAAGPVTGFNIQFFTNDLPACPDGSQASLGEATIPSQFVAAGSYTEDLLTCAQGASSIWEYCLDLNVPVTLAGATDYWLVIQGQLAGGGSTGPEARRWLWARTDQVDCEAVLIAPGLGVPNWTPLSGLGITTFLDTSYELLAAGPPVGACCYPTHCEVQSESECLANGGEYEGDGTACDPSPCVPVPTEPKTWGQIKSSF